MAAIGMLLVIFPIFVDQLPQLKSVSLANKHTRVDRRLYSNGGYKTYLTRSDQGLVLETRMAYIHQTLFLAVGVFFLLFSFTGMGAAWYVVVLSVAGLWGVISFVGWRQHKHHLNRIDQDN